MSVPVRVGQLRSLILDEKADIVAIGAYLDGLDQETRVAETMSLKARHQRRLWELAASSRALSASDFVPDNVGDLTEVIHEGRNSLPLFTRFQKRFAAPKGHRDVLFGYNEGILRNVIGPGYFVFRATEKAEWSDRGTHYVDYFSVPNEEVVAGWPTVVPNSKGLQMFVYNKTRDFMRRVSSHVTIGRAWKKESMLPAFFVLCRRDG